jgi:predicted nucleic acid-binding protein
MLGYLRLIGVVTDDETGARCAAETIALARQYDLTIYDAAYLELAIRRQTVLGTADRALARAAKAAGVGLLA